MVEQWRDVDGFTGYQVSDLGRIRTCKMRDVRYRGMWVVREIAPNKAGYVVAVLYKDGLTIGRSVHRLVAQAFLPNPDGLPEVDHLNDVRDDNRVVNLAWSSIQENRRRRKAPTYQRCTCCDACRAPQGAFRVR